MSSLEVKWSFFVIRPILKCITSSNIVYLTLCLQVSSADIKPLQTVWTQIRLDEMSGLTGIQIA